MHAFSVFGRDLRQTYLARILQASGHPVLHTTDEIRFLPTVLLPVPTVLADGTVNGTGSKIENFLASVPPNTTIWGSGLESYRSQAEKQGILLKNYSDFPEFAEKNAHLTAEGALQIALDQLPQTIARSHFLVIGYGRIGRKLAAMLSALGGIVTIASRTERNVPYRVDRTGDYRYPLTDYDAIFNTVPAPVLPASHPVKPDCLLVDLASSPGGIEKTADRAVMHALGLPAKTAPKTAAEIMLSVVFSEMEESHAR